MFGKRALAISAVIGLIVSGVSGVAWAQESDANYCDKVMARAHADASILYTPNIQAQFIKFPSASPLDITQTGATTDGYQIRALANWSPLDTYKGMTTLKVAEADCKQHKAMVDAMNVIGQLADVGRLPALQRQVKYLQQSQPQWKTIVDSTEARLKANVITVPDALAVREQALALDRKLLQLQGQLQALSAKDIPQSPHDVDALSQAVESGSLRFEKQTTHLRSLDPWTVNISAGLVPPQPSSGVQWFGVITLGFNFGEFQHKAYDDAYMDARTRELRTARYEMRDQLNKFRAQVKAAANAAAQEMLTVEAENLHLESIRVALGQTQATTALSVMDAIALQQIDLQGDRVYLEELNNQLSQWR
jgi:hypothetical protein